MRYFKALVCLLGACVVMVALCIMMVRVWDMRPRTRTFQIDDQGRVWELVSDGKEKDSSQR